MHTFLAWFYVFTFPSGLFDQSSLQLARNVLLVGPWDFLNVSVKDEICFVAFFLLGKSITSPRFDVLSLDLTYSTQFSWLVFKPVERGPIVCLNSNSLQESCHEDLLILFPL